MATKHFVRAFLFILVGLGLSSAQALTPNQVGDILVLVRTEVSGTDNIYHYELVNRGTVKMMDFSIGVVPVDNEPPEAGDDSYGTLTRLPTGTTWSLAPALSLEFPGMPDRRAGWDIPIPSQGSITSPTGWRAEISGIRSPGVPLDAEDLAEERYSVHWYPPKPVYGGPVNVTGADAGQRLAGFSVRVPRDSTTGPGAVGSAYNYTQGQFQANVWSGSSWLNKTEQKRRGNLIQTPSALVSFSSDLPGSETFGYYQINTTASNPVATITANIVPLNIGVDPIIKLESITCYGECSPTGTYTPTAGISGAAFGTDDRTFQLQGYVTNDYLVHSRYFMVVYSATYQGTSNLIYTGILLNVTGNGSVPPPGIPSSITVPATTTTGTYTVSWGAATGYVTHYELQEGTEPLFSCYMAACPIGRICIMLCREAPTIYSGPNLSFNVVQKIRKTGTLYYRVRACNSNTGLCSEYRTGSNGIVLNIP